MPSAKMTVYIATSSHALRILMKKINHIKKSIYSYLWKENWNRERLKYCKYIIEPVQDISDSNYRNASGRVICMLTIISDPTAMAKLSLSESAVSYISD